MKIYAIVNQKGGVGKTTTAVNLGAAFAAAGYNTLIIDLDPQGNATTGFAIPIEKREKSLFDLVTTKISIIDLLLSTGVPGLKIVPSNNDLLGLDKELSNTDGKALFLKNSLENKELRRKYDYIIIDCPPSLNLSTINALAASTGVLIPLQAEFYALEGLSQLISTIDEVKEQLNSSLKISGVILTMFDRRNNLARQVEIDVREYLKGKVFETVIPRNVRLSEAPSYGKPALIYDFECSGSKAYMMLASEILQQEKREIGL